MRKVILGGMALAGAVAAAVWLAGPVRAQGADAPEFSFRTLMMGGSRIGVAVSDADTGGVRVESVTPDTPASRAGLREGDVVVEFDGERVRSARQFSRLVQETPEGRTVAMAVVRDGSQQTLEIVPEAAGNAVNLVSPNIARDIERGLRDLPRAFAFRDDGLVTPFIQRGTRLGVSVTPLSDQLAAFFGVREGVLVSEVEAESLAARAGLQAGDVITAVDGQAVRTPADVREELSEVDPGDTVEIEFVRDRAARTATVTVPEPTAPPAPAREI